jgi:glycosyltransferase involved in cell wall biosynthesis
LKYVNKIFSVSNTLKELLEINNIKNVETIYNGINVSDWEIDPKSVEAFKKKYNIQNKKIILFGGRLSGAKGGDELLEAVSLIKKDINNIALIVIGKTNTFYVRQYVEKMKNLIKKFGIEENVIFTGWLDGDELRAAYHSMDVFLLPSIWFETFGMGNLEAMVCKKPVISTYFGGPEEVVGTSPQTGYLVNPNNVELMAKKILDLLRNPEKAKNFGEAGYSRAKEHFSLDKQAEETLRWYRKYV